MGNINSRWENQPAETSTCLTETATGAHSFKVTNYSVLDGMGVHNHVSSKTFSVGGYNWCIKFFPDVGNWAVAFLSLEGTTKEPGVKVKFTLSFLGNDGKPYKGVLPVTATRTLPFSVAGSDFFFAWDDRVVVDKCKLQDDDCFTIRCDLIVLKNTVA